MSELVNTYKLPDTDTSIPMDRDDFYNQQIVAFKDKGKTTEAIEVVNILFFNESGEMIIQKRAGKRHNPNLLDKSVG